MRASDRGIILQKEVFMGKIKKGQRLTCIPCGREVIISNLGIAGTTIWCCGRPMKAKSKTPAKKKAKKK
jgi:hypothetical protein